MFTSGGVGATHDDVTMEGVARAFGTGVIHHPRFLDWLRQRGLETTHRDLARVPEGCEFREGQSGAWPVVVMRNVWILPGLPPVFEKKLGILAECLPEGPRYFADEELVSAPRRGADPPSGPLGRGLSDSRDRLVPRFRGDPDHAGRG